MKVVIKILLLFCYPVLASAIELYQPSLPARNTAMGSTAISYVRGVDSLFLNPAALARVEGFTLNIASIDLAASTNVQSVYTLLSSTGASFTAADINSLYGEKLFTEVSARGGVVLPFIGVGAYSSNASLMTFNNPAFPTFNVDLVSDYGYAVGSALNVTKEFSLGLTYRHVKRWSGKKDILVTDLLGSNIQNVIEAQLPDKGTGNALDLGALYTIPGNWTTNLALVWKDLGYTTFQPSAGVGPEVQKDNLILGAAINKQLSFFNLTNALEYSFVRSEGNIAKKVHFGSELAMKIIDLRVGYSQGYLSYGAAFDLSFLRAEATFYTAELGSTAGQTPNNRYQASLTLTLDFDQSFKLQTADGKKRRLNQRR